MTLALLITAATGARAAWTGGTYTATANETLGAITVGADATLTINEGVTVTVSGGINANGHTLTVNGAGTLIVIGTNGENGSGYWDDGFEMHGYSAGAGSAGFTGTLIIDGATVNVTGGNGGNVAYNYDIDYPGNGGNGAAGISGDITVNSGSVTVTGGAGGNAGSSHYGVGSAGTAGQAVSGSITATTAEESDDNSTWTAISGTTSTKRYVRVGSTAPAVEVTLSDDKSEASFKMPQYDVTATYTLKRDLSVETQVTVGDDHDAQPRYRVQKQGNIFQPYGMTTAEVMALFRVHDQIENQDLAAQEDYTVQIYAVDIEGQPTGDAITFQNFTYAPGQYIVKAVAKDGSNYTGQTTESNIFTLFQGYEIVVAANEYATYYKDEALYIEDEDAQLYTITAVGKETATATEVTTAAANMPILVKNNSAETKTILLIPTTDQTPDDVTVADEFLGTLTVKEFTADETSAASYYVCNGKEFVQVRGAGSLSANKAYLKVNGSAAVNAPRLVIGFGGGEGTTGVDLIDNGKLIIDNDGWYDLNGRKLQGKPTQKGVYIQNGKKVVVK